MPNISELAGKFSRLDGWTSRPYFATGSAAWSEVGDELVVSHATASRYAVLERTAHEKYDMTAGAAVTPWVRFRGGARDGTPVLWFAYASGGCPFDDVNATDVGDGIHIILDASNFLAFYRWNAGVMSSAVVSYGSGPVNMEWIRFR